MVDALDIDWASLCKDMHPKPAGEASALKRFKPANVLAEIGISKNYAGDAIYNQVKTLIDNQPVEDKTEGNNF